MKTKLRNTWFSKLMALCLAVVMMLSMGITSFAAITPNQTANIVVNNLDANTVVTAYKVIDVNVNDNGQPEEPMYTWDSAVAAWLKTQTAAGYDIYVDANGNVTETFKQGADEAFKSFWHDLAAAIKGGTVTLATNALTSAPVAAGQTSATITGATMGQYLLTANGGVKIYQPTTVEVVPEYTGADGWTLDSAFTRNMKGEAPSIEKDAQTEDDNDKTVAIGDVVDYTLTVTVPSYPEDATAARLEVADTLSAGLTYNNDVTVTIEGEQASVQEGPDTYTVAANPAPYTFKLVFADAFISANAGKTIYVTYTATVNEKAFGTDALGNDAFLGYNNDPYDDSSFDEDGGKTEEDVYSYGVTLKKVDKNGTPLSGAEFTLSSADGTALKFNGKDGVYTYNSQNIGTVDKLTVDANGTLSIKGLDEGTYTLKETKAPNGYVLPNGEITIEIADAEPDGTIDGQGEAIVTANGSAELKGAVSIDKNIVSFNVQNTSSEDAGFDLPVTGGMGTMLFTIAGILLMGGAVALVVVAVRKRRA